jgi:uncharacterized protein YukE
MTSPGTILVNTPAVADAVVQVQQAATQVEHNHQLSLTIVGNNAENFGGRGSDMFQQAIALVNSSYARLQQRITQCGQALGVANDGYTSTDGQCAAQY